MVKIGYSGTLETFRIQVASGTINRWGREEIRDVSEDDAKRLLTNKDFYLVDGNKEVKKEVKKVSKVEVNTEKKNKTQEKIVFDLENADKDELLDFTALKGIDANYKMTIEELKEAIKKHEDGE